jgi:hypothetical protein
MRDKALRSKAKEIIKNIVLFITRLDKKWAF